MTKPITLEAYHELYRAICDSPRSTIGELSVKIGYGSRGQKHTTVLERLTKMYARGISLRPNLILRTFENCYTVAYFLKVTNPGSISQAFYSLVGDSRLLYTLFVSGHFDFFVTSRDGNAKFGKDLKIIKKSTAYTPIYTFPTGWNCETKDVLRRIADSDFSEGMLNREMEDWLPWEKADFDIFSFMRNNVQLPFSLVSEKTGLSSKTVKTRFYETISPYCNIAHYFFPKGYAHYHQSFILLASDHEKGIVEAFSRMPCTTYFFPLEEEVALIVFHEGTSDLMFAVRKMEEKGVIKKYSLAVPLHWE